MASIGLYFIVFHNTCMALSVVAVADCTGQSVCSVGEPDVSSMLQLGSPPKPKESCPQSEDNPSDMLRASTKNAIDLGVLQYGWKPAPARLIPLTLAHQGCRLFDGKMFQRWARNQQLVLHQAEAKLSTKVMSSLGDFKSNKDIGATIAGNYGVPLEASVSVSASAELETTNEKFSSMLFVQKKSGILVASVKLPVPDTEGLKIMRSWMTTATKERLGNVTDEATALALVKECGPFFITGAEFGATSVMTITTSKTKSSHTSEIKASLEASYTSIAGGISGSTNVTMGTSSKTKGSNYSFIMRAEGGSPGVLLADGLDCWKRTASIDPVVISYELAPLHLLADKGTKQREFLETAVQKIAAECKGCPPDAVTIQLKIAKEPGMCLSPKNFTGRFSGNAVELLPCDLKNVMSQSWVIPEAGQNGTAGHIKWARDPEFCISYSAGKLYPWLRPCAHGATTFSFDGTPGGVMTIVNPSPGKSLLPKFPAELAQNMEMARGHMLSEEATYKVLEAFGQVTSEDKAVMEAAQGAYATASAEAKVPVVTVLSQIEFLST